jgi:hypothetical protein
MMNVDRIKFPSMDWTLLEGIHGEMSAERREVLNALMVRYWKPVDAFLLRRGHRADAGDVIDGALVDDPEIRFKTAAQLKQTLQEAIR